MTIKERAWVLAMLVTGACARTPDQAPEVSPRTASTGWPSAAPSASTAPAPSGAPANVADASPSADDVLPNPCSGKTLSLESALFDGRCDLPEQDLSRVRSAFEAAPKAALKTTARLLDGGRIRFTVTNETQSAVVIPLMFHSAVDPFPVIARKGAAAPITLHGAGMMQPADPRRPPPKGQYLAITLQAGGEASVDLRIVRKKKVESLAHCPPNAKCAPRVTFSPLEEGTYALTIRGPFVALRDDLSATVTWTNKP